MWPETPDRDIGMFISIPMAVVSFEEGGVFSKSILLTQRYFGSLGLDV